MITYHQWIERLHEVKHHVWARAMDDRRSVAERNHWYMAYIRIRRVMKHPHVPESEWP